MALKTNGFTNDSVERYMIDAGAVYLNLVLDPETKEYTGGTLLGTTDGGNEFILEQSIRQISADGAKGRAKGLQVLSYSNPTLKTNLKELTAQNLSNVIAGSNLDTTSSTVYDILTSKGSIEVGDYISNVGLVGRLTGSNKPVIIIVENVLSIDGLSMKTEMDNEVVVPVSFAGHYDETGVAPYKIYFPKELN